MMLTLIGFFNQAHAHRWVMVSFSMPEQLLLETLKDCARFKIPAVINGLYNNSMPQTMEKIGKLSVEIPELQMQIDPTVFDKFHISQVPAVVVSHGKCFDVVYGNIPLKRALEHIVDFGECRLSKAVSK
jgi:conjugal transfer pilus assembly protein TrbC